MFGTKLRTWMEAHIVRSKKKKDRKKGEKGFDSTCNSPRSHSANRSPGLHQVHPLDSPTANVDGIRLRGGSYAAGTVTTSSGASAGTGSVNLSSPESAYSTGYSTDGTSPGTSFPPEYYINIRTGTHYFQSQKTGRQKRPIESAITSEPSRINGKPSRDVSSRFPDGAVAPTGSPRDRRVFDQNVESLGSHGSSQPQPFSHRHQPQPQHQHQHQQQETPRRGDRNESPGGRVDSSSVDPTRGGPGVPSSIPPPLVSPSVQSPRERSRIRTNPWLSANSSGSSSAGLKSKLGLDDSSSAGSGLKLTESSGSASDVNVNVNLSVNLDARRDGRSRRDSRDCREYREYREYRQESLSAGRSPINQNWRITSGMEIRPKISLPMHRRPGSSSSSNDNGNGNGSGNGGGGGGGGGGESGNGNRNGHGTGNVRGNSNGNFNGNGSSGSSPASSMTRSARSSEDDVTLNEMMGKFDESYVYEKETDILSDSDPTDCEDYVDSLSDLDPGQDAVDERDLLGNRDFDYIDNGSFLGLEDLETLEALETAGGRFPNTGHCTYFTFTGDLVRRGTRLRESLTKRRSKDEPLPQRIASVRNGPPKRQSTRHKKLEDPQQQPQHQQQQQHHHHQQSEKRKKRVSQRRKFNAEKPDDETANLNRVLVERMLLKNSGFNQGSRSVGGTPICLRRKRHDVNKNVSPVRPIDDRSVARSALVETEMAKRRSNSVSYVNGNLVGRRITGNAYMTTFASEMALIEADKEADRKYRELIMEAENILVNMQRSQNGSGIVPSPTRKFHNGLANKRVQLIKNTELNIELALSKSRNSQPELQSGSIRDLEHTSPKRQFSAQAQPCSPIHRFLERNLHAPPPPPPPSSSSLVPIPVPDTSPEAGGIFLARESLRGRQLLEQPPQPGQTTRSPDSPALPRRTPPRQSPIKHLPTQQARARLGEDRPGCNGLESSLPSYPPSPARGEPRFPPPARPEPTSLENGRDARVRGSTKEEGVTSSSSDSEDRCDVARRAPLMTFRSVDMGPVKESSSYCPQSEPVKRKVYAGSATYGRIQKTLGDHATLRNSDGDTAADDTDDSRRSLKEKVAQLRQQRLTAYANVDDNGNGNVHHVQDSPTFQHQLSHLRAQMLMQTIEGLKRSLEDQSATLKQTCLEAVLTDDLP